jgi:predicted N-acetyltransferase YhbS
VAELAVYLILGCGMFLALSLQALGVRAVPILACAAALAVEIGWRDHGLAAQLVACAGLLLVLGGYATRVLAMAVRHAF